MNRIFRCPDCNTPLIPGSTSCVKCGKQFEKPIPKMEAILENPILEGTEYHCPQCQAVLKAGEDHCANCGTQFTYPVPVYKMSYQEAQRLKQEEEQRKREEFARWTAAERERKAQEAQQKTEAFERKKAEAKIKSDHAAAQAAEARRLNREEEQNRSQAKQAAQQSEKAILNNEDASDRRSKPSAKKPLSAFEKIFISFIISAVVFGTVGSGIHSVIESLPSHSSAPSYTAQPSYAPPPSAVSPPYQAPMNTIAPAPQSATSAPTLQDLDAQFDAQNESALENISSQTGTNLDNVKIVGHAILREYVKITPFEDSNAIQTNFDHAMQGVNVLARYEAERPGLGCFQVAMEAAGDTDPATVMKDTNALRIMSSPFKMGEPIADTSDLAEVITGILRSR